MSEGGEGRPKVDEADLAMNVLDFDRRSFSFDRLVEIEGTSFAVFVRTETESESRFRPQVIRLRVVVPQRALALDLAGERLVAATDLRALSPSSPSEAIEAAAEPSRFEERGLAWRREALSDGGYLYVPEAEAARVLTPRTLALLELDLASSRGESPSRNRGSA